MPFTTTINYTQNIPVSFGLSNYINPTPSRNVVAFFQTDTISGGGVNYCNINIPPVAGVTVQTGRAAINSTGSGTIRLEGDVAAVNAALNGATYNGIYYSVEEVTQDFLSLDRAIGNQKGEMEVHISPDADLAGNGIAVGSFVMFSTIAGAASGPYVFYVTKIETTTRGTRLWLIYNRSYEISDLYYSSNYKTVNITSTTSNPCFLQTTSRVNIAPVTDISYANPQGYQRVTFTVIDGTTEVNAFDMYGSPQIAEPTFLTDPPESVVTGTVENWNNLGQMGTIAQADENYQSVQFLIKCVENDPKYLGVDSYTSLPGYPTTGTEVQKLQFIGNSIDAKASLDIPVYITDKSYGTINDSQVDDRASVTYTASGPVRWSFYGTPAECNSALGRIFIWRPAGFTKDFKIETRIVNSKTRIYSSRGK